MLVYGIFTRAGGNCRAALSDERHSSDVRSLLASKNSTAVPGEEE